MAVSYRDTVALLDARFVFWPRQREWTRAYGGRAVSRETVLRACAGSKLAEADLKEFERVQLEGIEHCLTFR